MEVDAKEWRSSLRKKLLPAGVELVTVDMASRTYISFSYSFPGTSTRRYTLSPLYALSFQVFNNRPFEQRVEAKIYRQRYRGNPATWGVMVTVGWPVDYS
jgi:hypothetical protein